MTTYIVKYRLGTSQYFQKTVTAPSQAMALKIFKAEMPSASVCGSPQKA